jgi:hypothetical protein
MPRLSFHRWNNDFQNSAFMAFAKTIISGLPRRPAWAGVDQ